MPPNTLRFARADKSYTGRENRYVDSYAAAACSVPETVFANLSRTRSGKTVQVRRPDKPERVLTWLTCGTRAVYNAFVEKNAGNTPETENAL